MSGRSALARACMAGIVSLAIGLAFVHLVIRQELAAARAATAETARGQAFALEKEVDRAFDAVRPLATLLRRGGAVGDFADLASEIEAEAGIAALLLTRGGRVVTVHPPGFPDAERVLEALAKEEGRGARLAGSVRLRSGAVAFLAAVPVDAAAEPGQVIAVVHLADWLGRAKLDALAAAGYAYRLASVDPRGGRSRVFARSSELALAAPIEERAEVPGGELLLALAPLEGWPGWRSRRLEILVAGLLSLLVALLTHDLVRKPDRLRQQVDANTRHLSRARQQLSKEIRQREKVEARQAWDELDRLCRLVMASSVQSGEGPADLEVVERQVAGALAEASITFRQSEVAAAVERLQERGLLRLAESRQVRLMDSGVVALPEVHRPLAEIARESLERVGPYLLGDRLGGGGMGEVYEATHAEDGTVAAVKLLYPHCFADPVQRRRFEREGEIAAGLDDPTLVKLLDSGEHKGRLYLVMERVQGETLAKALREGVPTATALAYFRDVAHALAILHGAKVIHRDLKPANIIVTPEGRCVLLDFGIARDVSAVTLTQTDSIFGTLPYIAPERLRGQRGTASIDIWAAGLVLHELLFGMLPWKEPNDLAVVQEIVRFQRLSLKPIEWRAGAGTARLMSEMLQPDPELRIADGPALLARMGELLSDDEVGPAGDDPGQEPGEDTATIAFLLPRESDR